MSSLKTNNISNLNGTLTIPTDTAIDLIDNGTAKAWVNFNGTGTVAIRAAFNVSSITDNGVGNYTVNFTNAMPDANYAIVATVTWSGGPYIIGLLNASAYTTTDATLATGSTGGAGVDQGTVGVAVFR